MEQTRRCFRTSTTQAPSFDHENRERRVHSAAIVVSESGILFAGESEVPDARKINATWVLEKKDGSWHIAAYHNSAMLAPAH
ncbi:nuclear transport factor 2 family protein [Kitasatospora sp. KL5]|uniref:nuclear transport factor 2 family protein n=1 Tax=Kitasatospora sp. KL5 TaxID=3425125 RepID=UPI003D6E6E37